ncbi:MAG: glycosyltransferase family 39 protein, partial [Deltaproteobacteria bacterium]|nr:glycosyltransferase family 39 protein [Deltaproteobacteria bacterium]
MCMVDRLIAGCPPERYKKAIPVLLIIGLNLAIYSVKINGEFLADDFIFSLKASQFTLTTENLLNIGINGYASWFYRPVSMLVWVLLHKVFGLAPFPFHIAIAILHVINCILLWFFLRLKFSDDLAFLSACIFSIFTGHIEAVFWLACIHDILCMQFFLLSLLFLVFFLENRPYGWYGASLAFALLAVMSKEVAAILPAVVFILSAGLFRRDKPKVKHLLLSLIWSVPYAVIALVYMLARLRILKGAGMQPTLYHMYFDPALFLKYWVLLCNLTMPFKRTSLILALLPFIVGVFLFAVGFCFLKKNQSRNAIFFGAAWLFITAFPTLGLIDSQHYISRFNYIPAAGFCLVAAQMLVLAPRCRFKDKSIPLASFLIVALYCLNSIHHSQYWKNAWQTSAAVQAGFRNDVQPLLDKQATVYFHLIPEFVEGAAVFYIGLPECFLLLSTEEGQRFSFFPRGIAPRILFSQTNPME